MVSAVLTPSLEKPDNFDAVITDYNALRFNKALPTLITDVRLSMDVVEISFGAAD